jgi:sarcosine oxidase subunit gamma
VAEITLTQVPPATGALPFTKGGMTLALVDPGPLASIAPFRGQVGAVSEALKTATGLALGPGYVASSGASIQWFGRDLWLLTGVAAPDLPGAALSDQTDAWVTLALTGPHIADVMARLVPLDLRDAAFPPGTAVRTELHGMMVALARTGPESLRIMAFRSMAGTLARTIGEAMENVAAL